MDKRTPLLWGLTLLMALLSLVSSVLLANGADLNTLMWSFVLIFGLLVTAIPVLMRYVDEGQPGT